MINTRNHVYDNYGENIAVTRGVDVVVSKNLVGDSFAPGIYVDNSHDVLVTENQVLCDDGLAGYDPSSGIVLGEEPYDDWGGQLARVTIHDNIVNACRNGVAFWGSDVRDSILEDIAITDNSLTNTRRAVIFLVGEGDNVVVTGNDLMQRESLFFSGPEGTVYEDNIERTQ